MTRKILTMFIAVTVASVLYAGERETKKTAYYSQLINESQKAGLTIEGLSPQNIEKYSFMLIQFADQKKEERFYYLQKQINFIRFADLYPSLDNLLKTALSDDKQNINIQTMAWGILASPFTKLEKNKPTTEEIIKFIETCKNNAIISEAIPVLVKLDKAKGFAAADEFINNSKVSLKDKMRLSLALMPFEYTGGYVILKDLLKSQDIIIRSNLQILKNYYQQYNL